MRKLTVALLVVAGVSLLYACTSDDGTSIGPGGADASTADSSNPNESDGSSSSGSDGSATDTGAGETSTDASSDAAPPKLTTDGMICTIDGAQRTITAIGTCSPTGVAAYDNAAGIQLTVGFGKMGTQTCAMGDTGGLVYARKNDAGVNETFIAGNGYASCTVDATSVADGTTNKLNEGTFSGTLNRVQGGTVMATNCAYRCTMP